MKPVVKIFFLLLILPLLPAHSQEEETDLLSIGNKSMSFEHFVREAEKQIPYYFFYIPDQLDSLSITGGFENKPLGEILEQVFDDSGFEYAIDTKNKRIFITQGQKISTVLSGGFFYRENDKSGNANAEEENQQVVDYYNGEGRKSWIEEENVTEIGEKTQTMAAGNATISGQVRNANTGEPVVSATVLTEEPFTGTTTDPFGNFSITIPRGRHLLKVRSVGMVDEAIPIILYSDGKLNITLVENVTSLREVEVRADRDVNVSQTTMGVEKINIRAIKQVPTVLGEPDVLRVVLTLPGVKTVGEASAGFNVRGGSVDQNLILYNDATVFNPTHLFGFFSAFNSDVLEGVELYKSSIPSRYGGRLSSVLEVNPRYGNKKKFEGKAGIGLLTSRFTLEGPIVKDKTSFIFGGRATYSNWILKLLNNEDYRNSKGSFYDLNLNLTHELSEKSNLYFTGYLSRDEFKLRSDTLYGYDNRNATLKWKNIFSNNLTGTFTASMSQYSYGVSSGENPVNAFDLSFGVSQIKGQADFSWSVSALHTLNFGISSLHYGLKPGSYLPSGDESKVVPDVLEKEQALESAIWLEDQFDITDNLSVNAGLRYSLYHFLGPKNVNSYAGGLPKNENSMLDTISFGKNDFIRTYQGPELRLSARYRVSPASSIKAGYNTLRQYIHMLSNTTAVSPTDIWKLSDPNIRPQFGEQFSFGYYRNMRNGNIETSVEGYYKNIKDYLDYKAGAELIMNHAVEAEVVSTEGKAYGAELMVKKNSGKLNGWLSYTWSRTLLRMDNPVTGESINRGEWYPANYDKPHDVTLVGNYRFSHRFSVSVNCTYSTGRPITLPIAKYVYAGSPKVLFSDRNAHRIPDYFRADLAMNIEGNHKVHQKTHNSWTFGVYNLTGRNNVYSVYFKSENGSLNGYKLSIFGSAIPFVNYNIRF